jgi:hydrogenase maturation protease
MSIKLIAIGNSLMKDDGIGIEVARQIEEKLIEKGIEVIYGETDFQYCFSKLEEEDFIFVLDAACYGKNPGEVSITKLNDFACRKKNYTQHSYSFLDLLRLYYPSIQGRVIVIEINEVQFDFGLSSVLQEKLKGISEEVLNRIDEVLYNNLKKVMK